MGESRKATLSIPPIQIRGIEASKLISNQEYQRPVNQRNVRCIENGYQRELVNPIKVSLRNGKYYVFDGQHTLTVLTELFGENCTVPCIVYQGLTYEREAELFKKQDEFKKKLSKNEQYRASVESKDENILAFKSICESMGFKCDFRGTGNKEPLRLSNFKYLVEDVYLKKGDQHLKELLSIIKACYSDDPDGTNGNFVSGLDLFITTYKDEYVKDTLVNSLRRVSPLVIVRNGKADMIHHGNKRYAIQIYDVYNKNKKLKLAAKF